MLILDYDPANQGSWTVENNKRHPIPEGYGALRTALVNAVEKQTIEARIKYHDGYNNQSDDLIDIDNTTISVASLRGFLKEKGFQNGFFFPEGSIFEDYLDPQNAFFAPKLAAAIYAWKTVTESKDALNGKTPKQALEKWLRENANKYGLTKDDGTPNETGIQEICKIANWKPEGGAAKTPTHSIVQDNSPTPLQKSQKLKVFGGDFVVQDDLADDIPF
jgi:hypothetical protein